jgi:Transposase DDE domain
MAAKVFLSYRRDASAGHAGRVKDRLDRMPIAMGVRRQTVEHPFGTLKAWMGATHFLTRTLDKVRTEMSLHVLAHNLKRMIKIFAVDLIGSLKPKTQCQPAPRPSRLGDPARRLRRMTRFLPFSATQLSRREWLLMPHSGRWPASSGSAQEG